MKLNLYNTRVIAIHIPDVYKTCAFNLLKANEYRIVNLSICVKPTSINLKFLN